MMRNVGALILSLVFVPCLSEVQTEFINNPKDGHSYKLMYYAQTWTEAQASCQNIGAKLAVPKTQEQFAFVQQIVRSMHYPSIVGAKFKLLAWVGISNVNGTWKNVDGENIEETGYHNWAGDNGWLSNNPKEPHCVGMDAVNPGYRDWWCSKRQPYICEQQI